MLKNHLNLQIVPVLFSGPPCTSQAKEDMGMSAVAFMTSSVGKLFLLSQNGENYPSEPRKCCEWDSAMRFHSSLRLWLIEAFSITFYPMSIWAWSICFLFKTEKQNLVVWRLDHLPFSNKWAICCCLKNKVVQFRFCFCYLWLFRRDWDISVEMNNGSRTILELDWLDLLQQICLNFN